jgi:hypothetical protein
MTQNQTKVLVALALACLVGTGLWMQHRRWDRLRQQQSDTAESLTAANAELVTLRTALENASNQLAQVAAVPDEMLRLRGEVARLRRDGGPQIQEGQSVSKKPIDNHQDQLVAANVVRSTIPLGRSVLTGGWMAPSGKRVLVVVQPTVDNSGEAPVITLNVHMLEGDEKNLRNKGYSDFLGPVTEQRSQRLLTEADLQTWVNNGDPGFTLHNLKLTLKSGQQGGLQQLFETTGGVGVSLNLVPNLSADGNSVQLLLLYGM